MASFKAKFPVLQELFAKNHRGGPLGPPPPAGRGLIRLVWLSGAPSYHPHGVVQGCRPSPPVMPRDDAINSYYRRLRCIDPLLAACEAVSLSMAV